MAVCSSRICFFVSLVPWVARVLAAWNTPDGMGPSLYPPGQLAFNTSFPSLQSEAPRVVNLGYASYRSDLTEDGVTSFLGIRYAASPTGKLRWVSPQPPVPVPGIQDATTQPPECPQAPGYVGSPGSSSKNPYRHHTALQADANPPSSGAARPSSEDCLFLNVHTPSNFNECELLPVVLYVHGGGYDAGNTLFYPVQDFVSKSQGGLVAVQVQYRIGVLGFLSGQTVKDGGDLNVGLLDQEYALKWIQSHIVSFGGDPNRVTIRGQSAGAGSVLQHIVARNGQTEPPLFRAAIMESPFLPFQYHYNDAIPERVYSQVADVAGCGDAENTLECLRASDISSILLADNTVGSSAFMWTYTFVPVVDGTFIRERPTKTLAAGRTNGDVLHVNTNSNEGLFFVNSQVLESEQFSLADYARELLPTLTEEQVSNIVDMYQTDGSSTITEKAASVIGDNIFVCPAYYALKAFALQGKAAYKSKFAIPPGVHAQDLSYAFKKTFLGPPIYNNAGFRNTYAQAFISTIVNLSPGWSSWHPRRVEMLFSKTESDESIIQAIHTESDLLKRCEFWMEMGALTAQ